MPDIEIAGYVRAPKNLCGFLLVYLYIKDSDIVIHPKLLRTRFFKWSKSHFVCHLKFRGRNLLAHSLK